MISNEMLEPSVLDSVLDMENKMLPSGVLIHKLSSHPDYRGCFTEIFRQQWNPAFTPIQWNLVTSNASVLRGVHVHIKHKDYFLVAHGTMCVGLQDLRTNSPTHNLACTVDLCGDELTAITIPCGVAHGFYSRTASTHIYSVTDYWDTADELGCNWQDPELQIPWSFKEALVSKRDATAESLQVLLDQLAPWQKDFI